MIDTFLLNCPERYAATRENNPCEETCASYTIFLHSASLCSHEQEDQQVQRIKDANSAYFLFKHFATRLKEPTVAALAAGNPSPSDAKLQHSWT